MKIQNVQVYTLWVSDNKVTVYDGRVKGARLKYRAPGLEIFIKGAVVTRTRDTVHYHACEIARAMHIPLRKLVSEGWV